MIPPADTLPSESNPSQPAQAGGGRRPSFCSPPLGESGEAYYCKRDDFTRYIAHEVNPAREAAGLQPLDERTAEECYRILNDFARRWGCKPIAENPELADQRA